MEAIVTTREGRGRQGCYRPCRHVSARGRGRGGHERQKVLPTRLRQRILARSCRNTYRRHHPQTCPFIHLIGHYLLDAVEVSGHIPESPATFEPSWTPAVATLRLDLSTNGGLASSSLSTTCIPEEVPRLLSREPTSVHLLWQTPYSPSQPRPYLVSATERCYVLPCPVDFIQE
ncbi:hypothetical protein GY45DRAFT_311939 [Cubamyces sp. BRFM 1775]|nr:hypothetical protein GY45DRAFT_311939 [Cubamyces sp. BRFM 1775]